MSEPRLLQQGDGFKLEGELSFATVPALVGAKELRANDKELELDLSGVNRADSAGLALLVHWQREAKARGGTIRFHNTPAQMLAIAKLSGVDELLSLD